MPRAGWTGPLVFQAVLFLPWAATAQQAAPLPTTLPTTEVIGASPLLGSGIDRDKVPAATRSFSSRDLQREGSPNLEQTLRDRVGSVTTNETQNNPFQPDIQYRGFVASPLAG